MKNKILIITTTLFLLLSTIARADEGMWLPSIMGRQIKDMQAKGFKLSAEDIYSVNKASMKDAIVRFGRGCTGELISSQGLLLTNHHCGFDQIQQHSSLQHDYLANGFWAMNQKEELPNPGLKATFLVSMDDVTARMMANVTTSMSENAKKDKMAENRKAIVDQAIKGTHYNASVESLYYGNQYFLFVYENYTDIRLVGAPPSSIGKFGGDTDNWMWPRHTGDFSLFRIYADKNNRPAPYSPDNVPYIPKKHFTISVKGIKEGDFTMIYGFPGRTSEYLVSDAVAYILNQSNPSKIKLRTMRLDIINAASGKDRLTRIKYASKAAGIANAWKKWQGESKGIARLKTIERKQSEEQEFQHWADQLPDSPEAMEYRNVLPQLHKLYASLSDYAIALDYYGEAFMGIELMTFASKFIKADIDKIPYSEYKDFYKDYSPEIDRQIAVKLLTEYLADMPEKFISPYLASSVKGAGGVDKFVNRLFAESSIASSERFEKLTNEDILNLRNTDPAVRLLIEFISDYNKSGMGRYAKINDSITSLYTIYMRGLMDKDSQRNFYPDANSTLRVAYGRIEGYRPQDGVTHLYQSTLEGIIAKDNPEIYDYDIPQKLREIYASKNYGRWAVNGTVPVAFLATNHTTGGNSGSPVLNARGELIGLNFDRTWLSTMSDIEFDPTMCRNIAADIRYVLFVVDKVGGAGYLLNEMTIK